MGYPQRYLLKKTGYFEKRGKHIMTWTPPNSPSSSVRPPAVAGQFYPGDAAVLAAEVDGYLATAQASGADADDTPPKALIVPHAGYMYSAPVAASAYARLTPLRGTVRRVVLMGPSHRVALSGLALSSATSFATPLGEVAVDREACEAILDLPQVHVMDEAHALEHSLEVHLPFLLSCLDDFTIVPLVAGSASAQEVAQVLERLWGGPEILIVISSDLSHYLDYETATAMDAATSRAIETLTPDGIGEEGACGRIPIRGLLTVAREKGLRVETVDLRNSGDTAGPRDQVVGYGSYVIS